MKPSIRSTVLLLALASTPAQAGWLDELLGLRDDAPRADTRGVDAEQLTRGLREALAQGVGAAVRDLGRDGGFWRQDAYRVPLPSSLRKAQRVLEQVGAAGALTDFHEALNHAAEQAVPVAAGVLETAVRQMSIRDAAGILNGGDRAATQYFERSSRETLSAQLRPLVAEVTQQNALAARYKSVVDAAGPYASMLGKSADLDGYVTERALDALFERIAVEEAAIRANPAGRGSELLERVFGRRG